MSGFKYRSEKSTTPMAHTSLDGMYIFSGSKVKTSGEKYPRVPQKTWNPVLTPPKKAFDIPALNC